MMIRTKLILIALFVAFITPSSPSVFADPPPWAPAHGWRKKHDPYYQGYSGRRWGDDYGIIAGVCQWEAVGTVVGGVLGGAVGGSVANRDNKAIGVILGSVIGAVIGNQIGKSIDDNDRGCIGHALELAGDRRPVRWSNPNTGVDYRVTPLAGFTRNGHKCREYTLDISRNGKTRSLNEKACLVSEGTWRPIN